MAGKSTYLRTVGINYLLACIGAPVCARQMEICPARLITSLRTSDSLNDNEVLLLCRTSNDLKLNHRQAAGR